MQRDIAADGFSLIAEAHCFFQQPQIRLAAEDWQVVTCASSLNNCHGLVINAKSSAEDFGRAFRGVPDVRQDGRDYVAAPAADGDGAGAGVGADSCTGADISIDEDEPQPPEHDVQDDATAPHEGVEHEEQPQAGAGLWHFTLGHFSFGHFGSRHFGSRHLTFWTFGAAQPQFFELCPA